MFDDKFYFICNHCGIEYSRKKNSFYYIILLVIFIFVWNVIKIIFLYIGRDTENAVNNNLDCTRLHPILCECYSENENNQNISCKYCSNKFKFK